MNNAVVCQQPKLKPIFKSQQHQESVQNGRRALRHGLIPVPRRLKCVSNNSTPTGNTINTIVERLYDVRAGALVHDMRNFLMPLRYAITKLKNDLSDGGCDPRCLHRLDKMSREAEMMDHMLEDVRAYTQNSAVKPRHENLAMIVRQARQAALDTFYALGRDVSPVRWYVDVSEAWVVNAVRPDLLRAFMNLFKNACESHAISPDTFQTGSVWLTAKLVSARQVQLIVRDNGMGLSPDELDDVRQFIPGGTSKKSNGTGFGLPIAKRKIEAHGGTLAINSVENIGTTVTVVLHIESGVTVR